MSTHVDRMKVERDELKDKLVKLSAFMTTEKFKELENYYQFLMKRQRDGMYAYLDALEKRIAIDE